MHRFLAVLVVAAAAMIGVAKPSHAAITFEFNSACISDCAVIGLNPGDAVSGTISFADAAVVPLGNVTSAAILDFSLDLGSVDIPIASAAAFSFIGQLDPTASSFLFFILAVTEAFDPGLGDTALLSSAGSFAGPQGNCSNILCAPNPTLLEAATLVPGELVLQVQEVPEPASLALFGSALVGLALARRRRKAA